VVTEIHPHRNTANTQVGPNETQQLIDCGSNLTKARAGEIPRFDQVKGNNRIATVIDVFKAIAISHASAPEFAAHL
jgi:hypothetical protein